MNKLSLGLRSVIMTVAGFVLLIAPGLLLLLLGKKADGHLTLIVLTTQALMIGGLALTLTGIVNCVIYTVRLLRSKRQAPRQSPVN